MLISILFSSISLVSRPTYIPVVYFISDPEWALYIRATFTMLLQAGAHVSFGCIQSKHHSEVLQIDCAQCTTCRYLI